MSKRPLILLSMLVIIAMSLIGCRNMPRKERNAVIGAGLGAAGGAILSDGHPAAIIGGAAAGGLAGNALTRDRE
ncbi:hypothetical protein TI05_17880, partial [Achromatium sp. WMS3]